MSPPTQADLRDFVVVDFDGTLANADVGNRLFGRFGTDSERWHRLIQDWKEGRITSRECLARECELAAGLDRARAHAFVSQFALVDDARAFFASVRAGGHDAVVASDGLSFYIEILLAAAGLAVPFRANEMLFDQAGPRPAYGSRGPDVALGDGRVAVAMTDAEEGCGACGHCKGALVTRARQSGRYRRVVLIGDGLSDRCGAKAADRVYAKDDLLPWCRAQGILATPFAKLGDVARAEGWPGFVPTGYIEHVADAARGTRDLS